MTIVAYAIGAGEGYIYCRAEYPLAIAHLKTAISQALEYGLLGDHILGTVFNFHLHIKEGAGAFVCGEETALMASIEGRRGEPRPRPPFPAVSGLWHQPSNVNNVKSYAMTPQIILNGAEWFNSIGTQKSPGTAIFALTGNIHRTGLIEVPMGIPLGEIIYDIGGGIPNEKQFKAVQTGGPLGGCLPASALDTPVDFDSLVEAGATMGSGGMIVVDEDTCMVEFARYFLTFASAESCGKCVPCRIGGQRLLETVTRITEGTGTHQDLEEIRYLSRNMREASLCALGQLTPGPVMAALRFFEAEFETHIVEKRCPAKVCKGLITLQSFHPSRRSAEDQRLRNEEYQSPGIGEDSDIDWRLQMAGVTIRNVKFSAVQYHLYHPRSYTVSDRNLQLLQESQQAGRYICTNGISQHQRS